jgi:hypothetical protein
MSLRLPVLVSAAALAIVASVATAAPRLLADLTGKWEMSIDSPGGPQPATMTVTHKDSSLTGTFDSAFGSAPLTGTVTGASVKFSLQIDVGGQVLAILGAAAVKDNTINGVLDVSGMGGMPFSAARKP